MVLLINGIRSFVFLFVKLFSHFWFTRNQFNRIVVFDLDNTIAYYDFIKFTRNKSISSRLKNSKVHPGIINLMKAYKKRDYKILILTARDYRFHLLTRRWLSKNKIEYDKLILVDRPFLKKTILDLSLSRVTYYDDLSYNHENFDIKYYDDLILYFSTNKNISFFGLNQFKRFQKLEL